MFCISELQFLDSGTLRGIHFVVKIRNGTVNVKGLSQSLAHRKCLIHLRVLLCLIFDFQFIKIKEGLTSIPSYYFKKRKKKKEKEKKKKIRSESFEKFQWKTHWDHHLSILFFQN